MTRVTSKSVAPLEPSDSTNVDKFPTIIGPEDIGPCWTRDEGELNTLEIELRFRWARDVKYLHESSSLFGPNAASNLSSEFSREDHHIGEYYRVACYVSQETVDAMIDHNHRRQGRKGYMTWQHVVALARVPGQALQRELLTLCLAEQWRWSRLSDEINARNEKLHSWESIECRTPSLRSLVTRIAATTSQLFDDTSALHHCPFQQPKEKLLKGTKATFQSLASQKQSISECIEGLQKAQVSLERALDVMAAKGKPSSRESRTNTGNYLD